MKRNARRSLQGAWIMALLMGLTGWVRPAAAHEPVPPELGAQLNGRWELAETAEEKRQRLESIDRATRSLPGPVRDRARGRILQRTAPRQELIVDVVGSTLTLSSDGDDLVLPIGGQAVQVRRPEGKAEVRAWLEDEQLVVESRAQRGTRTTRYEPGEGRLTLRFSLQGARLSQPVEFEATYVSASEASTGPRGPGVTG